jgi:hypothetical protein
LTCSALHTYATAAWFAGTPRSAPLASSAAALLLAQLRAAGELELAQTLPGGAGADHTRTSLLVDVALVLTHWLPGHVSREALLPFVHPSVKLAVQWLRKHCKGEAAASDASTRASTQVPCSLMADSSTHDDTPKAAQLRRWNACAHTMARPLWERCLQLVSVAADALVDASNTAKVEGRRDVVGSFVALMADAHPAASVAMILQLPVLVQTLLNSSPRGHQTATPRAAAVVSADPRDSSSAPTWLKPFFAWALAELRTGPFPSRQPAAAFAVGLVARLCCTPGVWGLKVGTCPRPLLLRPTGLQGHGSGALDLGSSPAGGAAEAARWKPFAIFWQQVAPSVHGTAEAAKADLARALAAVLRHATRQQLEAPASELSDAVQVHWSLVLEPHTPPLLRATLAREASVLFASGAKVLSLLENGACAATQGSTSVDTGALTQGGFLHQLGESLSQVSGTAMTARVAASGATSHSRGCLTVALGALAASIDFSDTHAAEGRKLLLWAVARLVDQWSAPEALPQQRLDAYRQLEGLPSAAAQQLDKVRVAQRRRGAAAARRGLSGCGNSEGCILRGLLSGVVRRRGCAGEGRPLGHAAGPPLGGSLRSPLQRTRIGAAFSAEGNQQRAPGFENPVFSPRTPLTFSIGSSVAGP